MWSSIKQSLSALLGWVVLTVFWVRDLFHTNHFTDTLKIFGAWLLWGGVLSLILFIWRSVWPSLMKTTREEDTYECK